MYIETSRGKSPRKEGDIARLDSPIFPATDAYCLSFWYHMFGPDINTLQIRQTFNLLTFIKWKRRGSQGRLFLSSLFDSTLL